MAIVALVLGSIWSVAASVRQRHFEQQFMTGLLVLHENVQKYFSQQSTCTGSYLYYSDPALYKILFPPQWTAIDVKRRINGPSILVDCPVGADKRMALVFWHFLPSFVCSSLAPKVAKLGKRYGITQYCNLNWNVYIPLTKNGP